MSSDRRTANVERYYTIAGIRFVQRELTFAEDGRIREVLNKIAGLSARPGTLAELLDAMYTEGIAEELFEVILKPFEPTPLHGLWHRWRSQYLRLPNAPLTGRSVIGLMRNSQVAEVLSDFFVLNTSWMSGFSGIVSALASAAKPQAKPTVKQTG